MAKINQETGTVIAHCPNCEGAKSTFEWKEEGRDFGHITYRLENKRGNPLLISYRLFRCSGCKSGAFGSIYFKGSEEYPGISSEVIAFFPESATILNIPKDVPEGIREEFREAEKCLANFCFRAAAGLFRSVLEKTMSANGYDSGFNNLVAKIDAAAGDGVITSSRQKRAHQNIRSLGNDVLHEDWQQISLEEVEEAHHYCQRILEDFYDHRESVLEILKEKGRVSEDSD